MAPGVVVGPAPGTQQLDVIGDAGMSTEQGAVDIDGQGGAEEVLAIKRTYQPHTKRRKKKHGARARRRPGPPGRPPRRALAPGGWSLQPFAASVLVCRVSLPSETGFPDSCLFVAGFRHRLKHNKNVIKRRRIKGRHRLTMVG